MQCAMSSTVLRFDPVFYRVLPIISQPLPAAWLFGIPSLPYQVLALFNMLPRAQMTINITVTFETSFEMLVRCTFPPSPPQS